jgi:hypothetical protein
LKGWAERCFEPPGRPTLICRCGPDPQSMLAHYSCWFMRHGFRLKAGMTMSEVDGPSDIFDDFVLLS